MSLSTTDALKCAIADLISVKLCLLDATDTNVNEEMEQIEGIKHYLESKLAMLEEEEEQEDGD